MKKKITYNPKILTKSQSNILHMFFQALLLCLSFFSVVVIMIYVQSLHPLLALYPLPLLRWAYLVIPDTWEVGHAGLAC